MAEDGSMVVEKVVEVPKALDPETLEAMKAEMEQQLKEQLRSDMGGGTLTAEQLAEVGNKKKG